MFRNFCSLSKRTLLRSAIALGSDLKAVHGHRRKQYDTYINSACLYWSFGQGFRDTNEHAKQAEKLITALHEPSTSHPDIVRAAELAQKAVSEGSSRGKTLLGSLYREGFGVKKDYETAERLFLEASEAGDPIAQCSLGVLKLQLLKEEENPEIEPTDFAVAVDEEGKFVASRIGLSKADGTPVNDKTTPAQLVRKVRKARRKAGFSDLDAQEYETYRQREEEKMRKMQRREAHAWLERSIEQGNDTAILALANDLIREDATRAVELYERAAKEHRNIDAYYNLGQIYERGVGDVPVDLKASFKNFSMGAQLGDASAQFYMGHLYHTGSFVTETDPNMARRYIEMAVNQGHPGAIYYYALMHRNGECGLEENFDEFRRYMHLSAQGGHGPALACLGDMYYHGSDGVETDYGKALEYFTRAGKNGESEALCSAAAMHFHGTGTKQDRLQAFNLYQDAAVKGSINALRNLSSMHFYGHGVPANKKLSEHFMRVADETERSQKEASEQGARKSISTESVSFDQAPVKHRHSQLKEGQNSKR